MKLQKNWRAFHSIFSEVGIFFSRQIEMSRMIIEVRLGSFCMYLCRLESNSTFYSIVDTTICDKQ